jgi:predicted RNA binding protein YcfA (HicA-like mRNA interferase family)
MKFANLRPAEVVRALERAGLDVHESHGSHVQMKHPTKPGRITAPYHSRFDIPKHVVRSIIRQAGLTNEQFAELLGKGK